MANPTTIEPRFELAMPGPVVRASVTRSQLRAYLEATGWVMRSCGAGGDELWQAGASLVHLDSPGDNGETGGEARDLAFAIARVALHEQCSPGEVLARIAGQLGAEGT